MAGRVIQGFFIGGAIRPQPASRATAVEARPRGATGAPPSAFAGRTAPLQARMAPGRPPLAHQGAGQVAQLHGGDGSFEIDAVQVGLARGGGKPLPEGVRAKMEAAFGADFSAVRVHVGPQASRIGAIAFTTGNDLYFAPGRYQPESVQGQQLIGHELAHVIQQRQGRVRAPGNGIAVVQDRMLEAEADRLGMRAAAHRAPLQAKMAGSGRSEAQVHISSPGGTSPGSYRLTAGSGPNPIGSLVVHTRRGAAAEITDLGVAPGHRDQGIGRQLLESAARAGLRSGNSKLSLSAQDNGTGKLTRWYKDMGFQQVGVNGRGMPVLEAPISRLLSGAVQRKSETPDPRVAARAGGRAFAVQRSQEKPKVKDLEAIAKAIHAVINENDRGKAASTVAVVEYTDGVLKCATNDISSVSDEAKQLAKAYGIDDIHQSGAGFHAEMWIVLNEMHALDKVKKIGASRACCKYCSAILRTCKIAIVRPSEDLYKSWVNPFTNNEKNMPRDDFADKQTSDAPDWRSNSIDYWFTDTSGKNWVKECPKKK